MRTAWQAPLWRSILPLQVFLLGGCDAAPKQLRQVDVSHFQFDPASADVVHELNATDLERAPIWKLDRGTRFTIAPVTDAAGGWPRHVLRLPDGNIAVGYGTGARVLVYNESAKAVVSEWGRKGAAPGEFQFVRWLGLCGPDGLYAFDSGLGTLTLFNLKGDLLDVERLPPHGDMPSVSPPACSATGNFVIAHNITIPTPLREGLFRPHTTIAARRAASESNAFSDVVTIPGADSYHWPEQTGPIGDFGRRLEFALGDSTVFIVTGDEFEVAEYSLEGKLLNLLRVNGVERPPVTAVDLERVRREQLGAADPKYHAKLEKTLASMEWPAFHPVLSGIMIDPKGCIWVKHNQPQHVDNVWRVLTRSGRPAATITTPDEFNLGQITDNELIGHSTSGSGGGEIVIYRYERARQIEC